MSTTKMKTILLKWISLYTLFHLVFLSIFFGMKPLPINAITRPVKTFAMMHWFPVTSDYDGSKLDRQRIFPWQRTEESCWGRSDYPMTSTLVGESVYPVMYTFAWLTMNTGGGKTSAQEKMYFVLDNAGGIWIDPDGQFHNPLYDGTKDPANPLFITGNCQQANRLEGRSRFSWDPYPDNNTQGPYPLQSILSDQTVVFQYKGRRFLIGCADREDYSRQSSIQAEDWDNELPLTAFSDTEKFVDSARANSQYEPDEWIYRSSVPHSVVSAGDVRLSPVVIPGSTLVYAPNTIVQPNDQDLGYHLCSFPDTVRYYDAYPPDGNYSIGAKYGMDYVPEFIYQVQSDVDTTHPGDVRLMAVNGRVNRNTGLSENFGLTIQDALLIAELAETNTEQIYAMETNYEELTKNSRFSVSMASSTVKISPASISLAQGTLVEEKPFVQVSFIQPVQSNWAGYLGFEWFCDNGVNNKIASETYQDPIPRNLSDDFIQNGQAEEIIGQYSRSNDLDYLLPLTPMPQEVCYVDLNGSGMGVDSPLYRDLDGSMTVSEGDERLSQVIVSLQNTIRYPEGSFVAIGDADTIFTLLHCPQAIRFMDKNLLVPDNSNNNDYNIGEAIYKKGQDSVNLGWVEANDFRITSSQLGSITYAKGTIVIPSSFYYKQSRVWGFTQSLSGDFRNLDIPLLKGKTAVTVTKSTPFQVEVTTDLTLQWEEPLQKGQTAWIIIDSPCKKTDKTRMELFRQEIKGPNQGIVSISLTPYLGSYSERGAEYPLSILIWIDRGGCSLSLPTYEDSLLSSYFYEPFYECRERKYLSELPADFFPDTFTICEEWILPENLTIQPSKKCISPFDSRFPNLWAKCLDVDNPADINDPFSVLASYESNKLFGNINAHGAGIEYYATARGYLSDSPQLLKRFIIQVNSDRTYYIWKWHDIQPIGVLNFGDTIENKPIIINVVPIWQNLDCSEKFSLDQEDWLGYNWITRNDALGCFDGGSHWISENPQIMIMEGYVETFGIDVLFSSYDSLNEGDPGGDFPVLLCPLLGEDSVMLRVFTTSVQYDYNSTIPHPPDFIEAPQGSIQYRGFYAFKTPKIEEVNFTNIAIVDHALQYSEVNYTAGDNPLSPLSAPVIVSPYNPLLMDYERDFIAYPAGQTHIARTGFRSGRNQLFRRSGMMGYNAYPSLTSISDPLSYFRKLGSENSPLTDYSFYFTLQNKSGEFYRFDDTAPNYLRIDRIVVDGPMKTTKIIRHETGSVIPDTGYPISYDYSGKLVIDRGISQWYQQKGENWTGRIGFGQNEIYFSPLDYNPLLVRTKTLDYTGFPYVFKIPEIIPTGGGRLHIRVFLADGSYVELGDCCSNTAEPGLRVHGLNVENIPDAIEINKDHSLKPVIREYEEFQESDYCNDAFVYLWQDRGIRMYASQLSDPIEMGAGDGRINMNNNEWADLDLNGKIAFGDFETEIIGTYDIASNTWQGGIYDARTFNVDQGVYPLELTEASNTRVTQFGSDFGNRTGKTFGRGSDHIISSDEECPVYISAYKFYDDNNDRAFTPLYRRQSHEVYLAGEKRIRMKPEESLIVDTYPSPLTAGCIPELIDRTTPLTFTVMDSTGKPLDFHFGVMDPQGESNVYDEDIHQHLFNDTPSEPLPQYYWTRTDLHNEDLGYDNNQDMYSKARESFAPIMVDFSKSRDGKYQFKNFCANDEGIFEVRVYSPDHLQMGRTWVRVASPTVEFQISPMELEGRRMQGMVSVSDPDFVMTAGVNRVYSIQIKAFNAQGQLIKGVDIKNPYRNPDEKEEIVHSGHLMPYTSKPGSFDLSLKFKEIPSPYYLHILYQNSRERMELSYSLTFPIAGFGDEKNVFYNTTNRQYENGLFSATGFIEPNTSLIMNQGWGFGCIYNSPREGVYLFPDVNGDKKLTKEDALTIGPDGTANVILFAEDICHFGVLVGGNYFTDSEITGDVLGSPPEYGDDPLTIRRRTRKPWDNINGYTLADGVFFLDWDAFPEIDRILSPPRLTVSESETKFPYRRDLLSPMNYDLEYAVSNSIHLVIQPADNRDLPITKGYIRLQGNTAESYVYGAIGRDGFEIATDILFTPTGAGESIAYLLYTSKNQLYNREEPLFDGPGEYVIDLNTAFDSVKALQISFPASSRILAGIMNEMTVKVTEKDTQAPVQDATISVSFSDFAKTYRTDANGEAVITISPKQTELVRFYAIADDRLEEEVFVRVVNP